MNPLTPLELLDIIEREHGFESPPIRLALNELDELKRDVARFIELTFSDDISSDDWQEYLALKDKLLEVTP